MINHRPLNTDGEGVARTITSDYGHSFMYHVTMDRDARFKMGGTIVEFT